MNYFTNENSFCGLNNAIKLIQIYSEHSGDEKLKI